ncbi:MAG: FixH family protein [Chloroflexi bacterium]|nr:FixH family protein [Chloroflexota bacterium]
MPKKGFLIVIAVLFLAVGIFISMRRSHMMSADSQVVAGGLVAVSKDGSPVSVPTGSGALPENTAIQQAGGLLVSLSISPYPPSAGQSSQFGVKVTDTAGQPVSDAAISLDLTMPSMWMPPNQLTMEPISNGDYQAAGRFTMRGMWRIEVIIMRGTEKTSAFFDVGL